MSGLSGGRRLRYAVPLILLLMLCAQALAQFRHVVAPGDTLFALAERYDTTVAALRQENDLAGDLLRVGQVLELPRYGFRTESVAAGETLVDVAERLGLLIDTLSSANPGVAVSEVLVKGSSVRVPPGDGLSVPLQEGVSVLQVALDHGLTPSELLRANGLESLTEVPQGGWLLVPGVAGSSARGLGLGGGEAPAPAQRGRHTSPESPSIPAAERHARLQLQLLREAPALLVDFQAAATSFVLPVAGVVSSGFGWRDISVGGNRFHGGVDLAVAAGTPVLAARDGQVVRSGWVGAYGYAVYLEHGDGVQTRYAHLSALLVGEGEFVRQGDAIGLAGSTGASTGPHLHFEIRLAGFAVDPMPLLPLPGTGHAPARAGGG